MFEQAPLLHTATRRAFVATTVLSAVAVTGARVAGAQGGVESLAIGLTRDELESLMTLDDMPVGGPGDPMWAMTYATLGDQYAQNCVTLLDLQDGPVCIYLEFRNISPEGLALAEADSIIAARIPGDAVRQETFVAPWTPAGEVAYVIQRYTRSSLAESTDGALTGDVLVHRRELWADDGGRQVLSFLAMASPVSQ